jgi:hypothetical protein
MKKLANCVKRAMLKTSTIFYIFYIFISARLTAGHHRGKRLRAFFLPRLFTSPRRGSDIPPAPLEPGLIYCPLLLNGVCTERRR